MAKKFEKPDFIVDRGGNVHDVRHLEQQHINPPIQDAEFKISEMETDGKQGFGAVALHQNTSKSSDKMPYPNDKTKVELEKDDPSMWEHRVTDLGIGGLNDYDFSEKIEKGLSSSINEGWELVNVVHIPWTKFESGYRTEKLLAFWKRARIASHSSKPGK
jgi:hypothetical protein